MLSVFSTKRGIRLMNAEAGIFADRAYLACAALSLGCGAILGFNAAAIGAALQLDSQQEVPLLLLVVGHRGRGLSRSTFD